MMKRNAIRKKIICLLATYLHKQPKPLSRPQEVEEIKEKEDEFSSDVPINTIVMPIRITFDNPIDFNHFSKPKDFKKDLAIALDSTESSIFPPTLLDSDSPFTAELSGSITLNSLGNEDKVFKPEFKREHFLREFHFDLSFPRPPPEPPDVEICLHFEPDAPVIDNFNELNEDQRGSEIIFLQNVEDDYSFTFGIRTFLSFLIYPEASPLSCSTKNEDTIFDPGIFT
ncbi:hypothetical protein Tco_1410943 [Tanacetum coccineum]